MSDKTVKAEPTPQPMASLYKIDADYLASRIGELNSHAVLHDGELCAKLNRARIGGMVEVLSLIGIEVVCNWKETDRCVLLMTVADYIEHKRLLKKENK